MRKSQRTALVAALILMAVPSAGRAGTLSPDDHGMISGISIDKTHGAIHRVGGIDPTHILFDLTDATSPKSAGFKMTESVRAGNSHSDGTGGGVLGGDETSARNGCEFHNFRFAGATRSVPEPTSLSLIALAGIGYVARFLRRHRSCLVKS